MTETGLQNLIGAMQERADLWGMGHGQNQEKADIGLGWLYYGLARSLRPALAIVIGSWRGFVPMLIGQALQDAGHDGRLIFIDPSLVDNQWKQGVDAYFRGFGIHCITHYQQESVEFLAANVLAKGSVDLLFIDGYHTYEQCRFEYEGFSPLLSPTALTLFHDSTSRVRSRIYGQDNAYEHTVWKYIDELKADPAFEVVDIDVDQGVAIVRRRDR